MSRTSRRIFILVIVVRIMTIETSFAQEEAYLRAQYTTAEEYEAEVDKLITQEDLDQAEPLLEEGLKRFSNHEGLMASKEWLEFKRDPRTLGGILSGASEEEGVIGQILAELSNQKDQEEIQLESQIDRHIARYNWRQAQIVIDEALEKYPLSQGIISSQAALTTLKLFRLLAIAILAYIVSWIVLSFIVAFVLKQRHLGASLYIIGYYVFFVAVVVTSLPIASGIIDSGIELQKRGITKDFKELLPELKVLASSQKELIALYKKASNSSESVNAGDVRAIFADSQEKNQDAVTEYFLENPGLRVIVLGMMVSIFGSLGGAITCSFRLANQLYKEIHFREYFFTPLNGGFLAAVVFLAFQSIPAFSNASAIDQFSRLSSADLYAGSTLTALFLGALTGLFADDALKKMRQIAVVTFGVKDEVDGVLMGARQGEELSEDRSPSNAAVNETIDDEEAEIDQKPLGQQQDSTNV